MRIGERDRNKNLESKDMGTAVAGVWGIGRE